MRSIPLNESNLFRCDRILWHGDGIVQLSYFRGESKFSDHRPVCAVFIVEVELLDPRLKKGSSTSNMKVGAEELLPKSRKFFPNKSKQHRELTFSMNMGEIIQYLDILFFLAVSILLL